MEDLELSDGLRLATDRSEASPEVGDKNVFHLAELCFGDSAVDDPGELFVDDRFGVGKVTSRIGIESEATTFRTDTNLFDVIQAHSANEPLHCVLIDEAQFLTRDQVFQLTEVTDKLHIPVLAYGLRTDFQGEPFDGSKYLLAWADTLKELKAICHCGTKATMVVRLDSEGNAVTEGSQVEIGGNDRYISMCRKHFKEEFFG